MADTTTDERALEAKELAEKCFLAGDIAGAKTWCQTAQKLAPDLPGVAQAAVAYDVHDAAARRPTIGVGRSPDWYAVLDLPPPRSGVVTHDAVKKQYRKLCLLVHPDKNTSAAADGAFKLVRAAWTELSARHPPPGVAASAARQPRAEELYRHKPSAAPARGRKQPDQPRTAREQRPPPPPPPPPPPKPSAPKRPQAAQTRRTAAQQPPTPAHQRRRKPRPAPPSPPPLARRSSPKSWGECQYCGAGMAKAFRCMSCHRSPMDYEQRDFDDEEGDLSYYHEYGIYGPWI